MSTVSSVFDIPSLQGCYLGIEVELENIPLEEDEDGEVHYDSLSTPHVSCIKDGSLRDNGAEFIFSAPYLFGSEDFFTAIDDINKVGTKFQATISSRTSCHVHMNVSDLTAAQLQRVMYLSLCLEPVLMKYCSEYRQHNRFCLPSYKSYDYVNVVRNGMKQLSEGERYSRECFQGCTKYAAISLHRLPSLGTVEYRMFDGTYDKDKLQSICKIVSTIRRIALNRSIEDIRTAKVQGTLYNILGAEISDTFSYVSEQEFLVLFEKGSTQANDLMLDMNEIFQKVRRERKKHESIHRELEQRKDSESNQREDQPTQGETAEQEREVDSTATIPRSGTEPWDWSRLQERLLQDRIRANEFYAPSSEPTRPSQSSEQQVSPTPPPHRRRTLSQHATLDDLLRDSEAVDSRAGLEGGSESNPFRS